MRAEPTPPPQGQPNGDWLQARPGSVTAGGSSPRRHRRAWADGGGWPRSSHKMAGLRSRRWGEPRVPNPRSPPALPTPPPGSPYPPWDSPTTPRAKVSAHYSRGSDSEIKRQGGARPSVKTTLPRTALPPSGPLTQYPAGDVPPAPTSNKLRSLDAVLRTESSPDHSRSERP